MRRWLLAVLSLHFFLSVGVFASGPVHASEPAPQVALQLTADAALKPASALPDGGAPAHAAAHAAADLLSDLPECLDAPIAASDRSKAVHSVPPPLAQGHTPPALDGPQRPPRGLTHLA